MNSLAQIRQILNTMESNVRGQDLNALQTQVADIEILFKDNRHVEYLVKMIRAIVGYLASRADNAHGQTVLVLRSLVDELAIFVESPGISPGAADEVLNRAFQSFKVLKSNISAMPLVSQQDIEELKSAILSIDWEISDLTLQSFDTVVNRLMTKVKSNKIHGLFLKIILSIGGYVARNKESSHRGALGLLRSVFQDYEHMVQNPAMTVAEKKQLIELDIQKFHEFKHELGRSPGKLLPSGSDSEEIMPALSHVKSSPLSVHGSSLSKLYDSGVSHSDELPDDQDQDIVPALVGKKKDLTDSRDMMDDLFTARGSDSDDLLDAIHLGGITGEDQGKGMGLFETPDDREEQKQEGVKHFTPQRGEQEPIPEIESRLEEFFNLEFTEGELKPALHAMVPTSLDVQVDEQTDLSANDGADYEPDDQGPEPIVPFQYEDEVFEEDQDGVELFALNEDEDEDEDENEDEDKESDKAFPQGEGEKNRVPAVLDRLKTFLVSPDGLTHQAGLTDFTTDIYVLEQEWQDDFEKRELLEMIVLLARHIHGLGKASSTALGYGDESELEPVVEDKILPPIEDEADSIVEEESDSQVPVSRGVWGRIRSMFFKP